MKRILSVILSLVLLVSVLVIPMTTSAYFNYAKNDYDCTVEQVDKETYAYNSGEGNLILGKFPQGYYKTAGIERTAYSHPNFAFLTDGDLTSKMIGVPTGVFADSNNNLPNGYKGETQKYNFDEAVITNYEDLVFDLGGKCEITAFINFDTQVWHAPGLYQVYVAETEADLFTSESHVLNYQRGSENELSPKFVFNGEKKPVGRYFGIRYLAAVTPSWGGGDAYALRIAEFAVYGNSLEVATTVFNVGNEGNTYYNNGGTIISHGISPVYQYTSPDNGREIAAGNTYYGTRIPSLTDGDISKRYDLPTSGFGTSGVNGYFYYGQAGYTKNYDFKNNKIDTYADMIFDFGGVASIDKIQLFSEDGQLTTTLYQIYASTDANKLFDEESNVLNYQAVDLSGGSWSFNGGQQHVFSRAITARYVAIRVVHPTIDGFGAGNVRIKEIAIYGTNDSDYNVVKSAPGFPGDSVTVASVSNPGAQNLLGLDKLTVTYCNNGTETEFTDFSDAIYNRLHDGGAGSNVDFYGASFNNEDGTLKNGYNITLNSSGKVSFTRNTNVPIDNYTCFTYDLGNYYNLSELQWFSYNGKDFTNTLKTQAYEVYVGNDKDTLYTDPNNKVLEYNNYFNMQGQIFTFNKKTVGRYLGVKVLMAALDNGTLGNYCRISEIAAYGNEVGAPPVITGVEDGKKYCESATVTVTDTDIKSIFVNGDDKTADFIASDYVYTFNETKTYTIVATDNDDNITEVTFTIGGTHSLKYAAEGAVITEICSNCDHKMTLTLETTDTEIVYNGNDQKDSIIANKTNGFVGTVEGDITFEQNGTTVTEVKNAGVYAAKVTVGDATAILGFVVQKAIPTGYTVPSDLSGEAGNELNTITLPSNFTWKNSTQKIKYGKDNPYKVIYTPDDIDNYKTVENIEVKVNGTDITPPSAQIEIKGKTWTQKVVDFLFGWFIGKEETVTITGSDKGSGVANIFYYVTNAEVDEIDDSKWTEYTEEFKIEKEGNNVVYAKVVDKKGNSATINTEGIVLDTIAPTADVIDKGTYYGSLIVTVTDANLKSVTIDGKEATVTDGKFTVSAAYKAQEIVITDEAGNTATYTVTVIEAKGFDATQEGGIRLTVDTDEKNIADTDKEKIAAKIEKSETVSFFDISVNTIAGNPVNTINSVAEIPVDFNFTDKLNIRVLHNHGGNVKELKALTSKPTADFENGTYFADKENGKLYIYTKEFSAFAVAFHVHDVKHVEAKAATAEADGNIEYWYCEGCDKYFSDAAATKEISKADTVVKYPASENNSGSTTTDTGTKAPGGTSPVTGQTAMTIVLFTILLGALAIMGVSVVKSRKAKSK